MTFRKDINSLRAIAVLSVVLFHFNSNWIPGGFAGVDIFFVISGYLMTGIIITGLSNNSFSIVNFLIARVNRIIPALSALIITLLLVSYFFLTPNDYEELGIHALGSITFTSNIIFWKESTGYFNSSAHEKWLLHTWSLSAEWQFYLLYPIILTALTKIISPPNIKRLIFLGTLTLILLSIFLTSKWPTGSYYLLPTRAWEMLIGGLAFLYPLNDKSLIRRKIFEYIGMSFIISSFFIFSSTTNWPGYSALAPTIGTYLVILANNQNSMLSQNLILQNIGKWSYSIYLWHWPIAVGVIYFNLNPVHSIAGAFLSIVIGFFSYTFIEKATLPRKITNIKQAISYKPALLAILTCIFSSYIWLNHGMSERFSPSKDTQKVINQLVMPYRSNGYCYYSYHEKGFSVNQEKGTQCFLGDKDTKANTLLFGDSFAGHNEPFFDTVFKKNNASFQSIVTNWCAPSLKDDFPGPESNPAFEQCLLNRSYVKNNITNYKNIILAGSWDQIAEEGQLEDTINLAKKISQSDVNVFIMAGPYRFKENPLDDFLKSIYLNHSFDSVNFSGKDESMKVANQRLSNFAKKSKNIYFISRDKLFNHNHLFYESNIKKYIPYTFDGGHISILGSKYSAKLFMQNEDNQQLIKLLTK